MIRAGSTNLGNTYLTLGPRYRSALPTNLSINQKVGHESLSWSEGVWRSTMKPLPRSWFPKSILFVVKKMHESGHKQHAGVPARQSHC